MREIIVFAVIFWSVDMVNSSLVGRRLISLVTRELVVTLPATTTFPKQRNSLNCCHHYTYYALMLEDIDFKMRQTVDFSGTADAINARDKIIPNDIIDGADCNA